MSTLAHCFRLGRQRSHVQVCSTALLIYGYIAPPYVNIDPDCRADTDVGCMFDSAMIASTSVVIRFLASIPVMSLKQPSLITSICSLITSTCSSWRGRVDRNLDRDPLT